MNQIKPTISWSDRLPKTIKGDDGMSFDDIANIRIWTLGDDHAKNPWLFKDDTFKQGFDIDKARKGSKFFDRQNGDKWRVISANPDNGRFIAQNLAQDFIVFFRWPK